MMTKDVLIRVQSTQELDGDTDTMELMVAGEMQWSEQKIQLQYEENQEDGKLFSTVTVEKTPLFMRASINRTGVSESNLTVEKGKRHHSIYNMGPYEFALGVYGKEIACTITPKGGTLTLAYTLDMNGIYTGKHSVCLDVKTKE